MPDKITLILQEESNRYLAESIESLSAIADKDLLNERYTETVLQLIDDGYTLDEISVVTEQNQVLTNNLTNGNPGTFNIWNTIFGGGASALKEQIIRFILVDIFGFSEMTGQDLAIIFKRVSPLDIIKLFRGKEHCMEVVPTISLSLAEVLVNNSQFGGQSQQTTTLQGIGKVGIRNIIAQAIDDSNLGEKLGEKLCSYIWDKQPEAAPQAVPQQQAK